jgi:hypothetical protein
MLRGVIMFGRKKFLRTVLSPHLREIWGFVPVHILVLATPGYIVFLDEALDVDWKSTPERDREHAAQRSEFDAVLNRAAAVESADWDGSDEEKTIKFKRQIGEAVARGLEGNYPRAMEMLDKAEEYRQNIFAAARRRDAIKDQVTLKDSWRRCFRGWTAVHYVIGIGAILLSTLVASKPAWLDGNEISFVAWLVAAFTGLLTFLTPDKKADKYIRAWSILSSEITRYNTNQAHTIEDVLNACHYAEGVIFDTANEVKRK